MGCSGCSTRRVDGKPAGCNSNGGCSSGGCNRLNTFNWLSDIPLSFGDSTDLYEITFNSGSRKDFYRSVASYSYEKNDFIVVETKTGYDIGQVSLRGELVKLQMKKKRFKGEKSELKRILRTASEEDMSRWVDAKSNEQETMVKSRVIARDLGLDMKVGQVEYQADGRKATFYYIADGRVDFRQLIKEYARQFKVKIEMRQIGARQEAGKIGGIGSCGRELCCSTWLTNFKSVSTTAARYQNLAINQSKLSGQCGRLKCCLNYELDSYMDALKDFPKQADRLHTEVGEARLVKTDIFKGIMWYQYRDQTKHNPLTIKRVNEILEMNKAKKKPETLIDEATFKPVKEVSFEDGSGVLTLENLEKTTKRNKRKQRRSRKRSTPQGGNSQSSSQKSSSQKSSSSSSKSSSKSSKYKSKSKSSKYKSNKSQSSKSQDPNKQSNKPQSKKPQTNKPSSDKPDTGNNTNKGDSNSGQSSKPKKRYYRRKKK